MYLQSIVIFLKEPYVYGIWGVWQCPCCSPLVLCSLNPHAFVLVFCFMASSFYCGSPLSSSFVCTIPCCSRSLNDTRVIFTTSRRTGGVSELKTELRSFWKLHMCLISTCHQPRIQVLDMCAFTEVILYRLLSMAYPFLYDPNLGRQKGKEANGILTRVCCVSDHPLGFDATQCRVQAEIFAQLVEEAQCLEQKLTQVQLGDEAKDSCCKVDSMRHFPQTHAVQRRLLHSF